jgi:hypothetical protein
VKLKANSQVEDGGFNDSHGSFNDSFWILHFTRQIIVLEIHIFGN